MKYHGDIAVGATIRGHFNTRDTAGAPITLAGTPTIRVYKDGSTTEDDSGITLTVDFDARTGLHQWVVDTSADGTFYSAGSNFVVVITAGTAGGISVVGVVVGEFSIENRSALRPTVAGRTLDVAATGEAGLDFNNILSTSLVTLHSLTVTGATTLTGAVSLGSTLGVTGTVTFNAFTVTSALTVSGTTTLTGAVTASNASNNIVGIDVAKLSGDSTAADNAEAFFDGTGYAGTGNVIPTVTNLTNLTPIPANWLTAAGTAGDFSTEIVSAILAASLAGITSGDTVGFALKVGKQRVAGKTFVDVTNDTQTIYDTDGTTVLVTLNLTPGGGPYHTQAP